MTASVIARVPIGIVVRYDRAIQGICDGEGGTPNEGYLRDGLAMPVATVAGHRRGRPEADLDTVAQLPGLGSPLALTAGWAGSARRDVTPEPTADVYGRLLSAFGELTQTAGLADGPTVIPSRQTEGGHYRTLLIKLPENPASVRTWLNAVPATIPCCIDLKGGSRSEMHTARCTALEPVA